VSARATCEQAVSSHNHGADELFFGRAAHQIWGGYDPPPFFVSNATFAESLVLA
jgi:hypothetical protein